MKSITIKGTNIPKNKVLYKGNPDETCDYMDLIEYTLDVVPQGGFKPSDIRERNRIQLVLDKGSNSNSTETFVIDFEDADFENLKKIVSTSRWSIRDKELAMFLEIFKD